MTTQQPLKLLHKSAFFFSTLFSISMAITNTLYATLYVTSSLWVVIGILMAISNLIATVMTVYNMTNKVGTQIHFESSLSETIQKNTYTKAFTSMIIPSLLLHWISTGISSYTSMLMLGRALEMSIETIPYLGAIVAIIALCATCTLNLTQAYAVLYKLAQPKLRLKVSGDRAPASPLALNKSVATEELKIYRHMFTQTIDIEPSSASLQLTP